MADWDFRRIGARDAYPLMTRVVGPRPIALISTLDAEGRGNLAPFSYFVIGGANPPSLAFCPTNTRDGLPKDTLANVEATGEFVVNVVTFEMAGRMNETSRAFPRGTDEFDRSGFTRAPSLTVRPPRVAESPIHLEGRVFTIVRHGTGPLASNWVIGEITHLHADESVLTDGLPDSARVEAIGRLGGDWYCRTSPSALFTLARPGDPAPGPAKTG